MLNSDLSPAAPHVGREPHTDKTRVVSTRRRFTTNWVFGRTLQPSIESVVANSFVPSDFLVSRLGTVHFLLTLSFHSTWILPLHVVSCCVFSPLSLSTKTIGDGAMDDGGRLRIELAASNSCSARRPPWSDGR